MNWDGINEVVKQRGLKVLQKEGLLDDRFNPVHHELVDLSTIDRTVSEIHGSITGSSSGTGSNFFHIGQEQSSVQGSIDGRTETLPYLMYVSRGGLIAMEIMC